MASKDVTFPSKNAAGEGRGVLFGEPQVTPRGLVVVHAWWGMNEQIKAEGARFAGDGRFTVLVVDMYRGKVATDYETAGHYMGGLDWEGALQDVSGAAGYLKSIGCVKVGATGFCMGGAVTFAAAARCPEVDAAAPFYGIPRPDLADLTTIRVPVQGHFGELDDVVGLSSPSDYNPLNERLLAAGVPFQLYTYPGGHAFANSDSPNYNREAGDLAFGRLIEFMTKHLGQQQSKC